MEVGARKASSKSPVVAIVIAVVVLAVIGLGAAWYFVWSITPPKVVAQTFLDAQGKMDWDTMSKNVAEKDRAEIETAKNAAGQTKPDPSQLTTFKCGETTYETGLAKVAVMVTLPANECPPEGERDIFHLHAAARKTRLESRLGGDREIAAGRGHAAHQEVDGVHGPAGRAGRRVRRVLAAQAPDPEEQEVEGVPLSEFRRRKGMIVVLAALGLLGLGVAWYFLVPVAPPEVVAKTYLEAERSQNWEAVAKCLTAKWAADYRKLPRAKGETAAATPAAFVYGRTRYEHGRAVVEVKATCSALQRKLYRAEEMPLPVVLVREGREWKVDMEASTAEQNEALERWAAQRPGKGK